MRPLLLSLLLPCVLVAACRTAPPAAPPVVELPAPPAPPPANTLGPSDLVEVRVTEEPEQSGTWRLSSEGTIDYPLCGKVKLEGHTASMAADALRTCLSRWLRRPQVSVTIREYTSKKIYVLGEVQKPGTYLYDEQMTIVQAIALAGGFTKLAQKNGMYVTRLVQGEQRKLKVPVEDSEGRASNFPLHPGDVIFVPESLF